MKPRFVGDVDFAPMNPSCPEMWQLEQPFAQVTSDGYLAIARPWRQINGASIPRLVQAVPKIGHPFEKGNKFWSVVHDQGYHGDCLVLRLSDMPDPSPEYLLSQLPSGVYVYELFANMHVSMPRRWYDRVLVEAMQLCTNPPQPGWKQVVCWSGVRVGGWKSWRKE